MKRKILLTVITLLCGAALFAQTGRIKELAGTVELKHAGAAAFVPAKAGDAVPKDTIVSTGFKSSALIEAGSSVITVRPLTRLSFAELASSGGTETINVNLQTGRVRVDVNPPVGTRTVMSVRGPSATASVRGTSFEFDTYSITVLHGKVAFQTNQNESARPGRNQETAVLVINTAESSEIQSTGRVTDPLALTKEKLIPAIIRDIDSGAAKDAKGASSSTIKKGSGSVSIDFVLK